MRRPAAHVHDSIRQETSQICDGTSHAKRFTPVSTRWQELAGNLETKFVQSQRLFAGGEPGAGSRLARHIFDW